jgi:Raf kinase inhibitor-like YbhB/YbcL family protein
MRVISTFVAACVVAAAAVVAGQAPGGAQRPGGPGGPAQGGRRPQIVTMTLSTSAWTDGGAIPAKYTQAGLEVSPALAWADVPDGISSFVLIAHDLDAPTGNGTDDILHWMLWNVPGASRGLAEAMPMGNQLPDGTRQISASGPYYRGPGAMAAGPTHHYIFELYALDTTLDAIQPAGQPPATRAAVMAAMAGHVRGKASLTGLFKRAR